MSKTIKDIYECIDSKKGENITVIDFKNHHPLYDYFIIATVLNDKMAVAIMKQIEEYAKLNNISYRIEGRNSEWTLIDLNDIVVHLFTEESRNFYHLERLFDSSFVVDINV